MRTFFVGVPIVFHLDVNENLQDQIERRCNTLTICKANNPFPGAALEALVGERIFRLRP